MFRESNNAESNIIQDSFRADLEHSFFRNIQDNITKENNFEPVENFSLDDDEARSIKRLDFNDHQKNKENIIGNLLSTKSSYKEDPQNLALQKLQGSNSHVFFSGYFGEKKEDARGDGNYNNYGNVSSLTNPFAFNDADHGKKTFGRVGNPNGHLEMINVNTRIMNCNHGNFGNFNGSFLTHSISNGNLNRSNTSQSKIASNQNSFNDLVKSVSIANFQTEILSTEELLIEKIKKEKEEMHRLKSINKVNVEKVKNFVKQPVLPQPLTLIKPFNLSMNNSKLLMKKRVTNTNVEEINSKITETMKKKCEKVGDNLKEAVFAHEKIVLQKPEHHVRHIKKSLGRSVSKSKSRSKSPIKAQNEGNEDDVTSLTSRIEKYCVISGYKSGNKTNNKSKSPLKSYFSHKTDSQQNEDRFFNNQVSCILMNSSKTLTKSTFATTSIRKHFNSNQISTEDKIIKDMQNYKFTPKPLNKNIFAKPNKKVNEIESFESILMKTRIEKSEIEKADKEKKKMDKVNQMKVNKLKKDNMGRGRENRYENKENFNSNLIDGNMILEL